MGLISSSPEKEALRVVVAVCKTELKLCLTAREIKRLQAAFKEASLPLEQLNLQLFAEWLGAAHVIADRYFIAQKTVLSFSISPAQCTAKLELTYW
jgi:hypothetical protein